jgi:hypothetical protein
MSLTVKNEISSLRNGLRQITDDSDIRDSFIYAIWKKMRAEVLKTGKFKTFNLDRFCIKLEVAKSHNCDCVDVGCDVLKTEYEIPEFLQTPYNKGLKVRTLGGKLIGQTTDEKILTEKTDVILNGKARYSINSRKIVIWRNLSWKAIELEAVWADPLDWVDRQYCSEDEPCYSAEDISAGVTEDQSSIIYKMAMNELRRVLGMPEDQTNDRNPDR